MRHGHTAWNRAGRIQGQVDQPLDAQARDYLAGLRLPDEFDQARLVSSPLRRAIETARLVSGREPDIVPQLVEMDWGSWQGLHGVDLLADPNSGYRHLDDWNWNFRPPGGESLTAVWQRVEPWIRSARGRIAAVTHIGVMRVVLARARGGDFCEPAPPWVKRNRLYVIEVDDLGAISCGAAPVRLIERERR